MPMTLYNTQMQPAKAARDMTDALAAFAVNNFVTFVRKGLQVPPSYGRVAQKQIPDR